MTTFGEWVVELESCGHEYIYAALVNGTLDGKRVGVGVVDVVPPPPLAAVIRAMSTVADTVQDSEVTW